jgi:hypothetical protein
MSSNVKQFDMSCWLFEKNAVCSQVLENMDENQDGYVDFEEMKRAIMEDSYSFCVGMCRCHPKLT